MDLNGEGFNISFEDAKKLFYKYTDLFSVGVNWIRENGRAAARDGYLVNMNGRRRYWFKPDPNDTEKYPNGRYDENYKAAIGAIEREGGNFVIQSVNADMTKVAMTNIRRYKKKHNVRTTIVNAVYDEVVTNTHKDDSEAFVPEKRKIMIAAGERWIKSIPVLVDGVTLPYWTKD